jgi:hypothetical protein
MRDTLRIDIEDGCLNMTQAMWAVTRLFDQLGDDAFPVETGVRICAIYGSMFDSFAVYAYRTKTQRVIRVVRKGE